MHPDLADYELSVDTAREGNLCGRTVIETGDVAAAFARAALVVEGEYATPRVHQGYIEPRACLAVVDEHGGFHVTTSTQNPFGVRATLCSVLGLPESQVRVTASTVGGGFGGKLDVTFEHFACLLARKSGRPVKMVSSRAEELATANPRENSVVRIRSAVDDAGRIIGREVECLLDAGAYAHDTPFIAAVATLQATGPYLIENVRSTALSVYTNTQPTGAYRGPSGPQMVLAVEAHMEDDRRSPRGASGSTSGDATSSATATSPSTVRSSGGPRPRSASTGRSRPSTSTRRGRRAGRRASPAPGGRRRPARPRRRPGSRTTARSR